jgi:hypothetical protein
MRFHSLRNRLWVTTVVVLTAVFCRASGMQRLQAQQASELELKVALLYNFAKFVEWPTDSLPGGAPITLCIVGDQPLRTALGNAVKGRAISGHDVVATDIALDGPLEKCQVLYAPRLNGTGTQALLKVTATVPVFTLSDNDKFAELGGVANFVREGDRLRFAINVDAARKTRLQISSKLLALAIIVKSTP